VLLNDVSLLHVPARSGLTARWTTPLATRGATPAARNGHSFTADPEGNAVLLFGGADDESHRNDVWRLTLGGAMAEDGVAEGGGAPCAEWAAMACTGIPPQPREMHIAAVLPTRRRLLVHGGRSGEDIVNDARVLCLKSWVWSNPLNSACRRVGHAVTLLPAALAADAPTAKLILFGGFTGEGLSNDVWTVAPDAAARGEAGALEQVPTRGAPATRFAHCVAAASDRLLIFGGSAPASECDDLFEVRLPLA
jgi:dynein heavy chain